MYIFADFQQNFWRFFVVVSFVMNGRNELTWQQFFSSKLFMRHFSGQRAVTRNIYVAGFLPVLSFILLSCSLFLYFFFYLTFLTFDFQSSFRQIYSSLCFFLFPHFFPLFNLIFLMRNKVCLYFNNFKHLRRKKLFT